MSASMAKTNYDLIELKTKFDNVKWTNSAAADFNHCVKKLEGIVKSSKSENNLYKGYASRQSGQIFFDNDLNLISYVEGSDYATINIEVHKKIFTHYGINLIQIPIPNLFKDEPSLDYMQQYVKLVK